MMDDPMQNPLKSSDPFAQAGDDCLEAIHTLYHFLDGELTTDRRAQIQQHLDDCPPCIKAYNFEAELRLLVSRGCQESVPDSLRQRIAMLIEHERMERGISPFE
jgi:mycothiol system anti-sigma-R factor